MNHDLSQFLQTFYEESFEGLESMESSLLDLDLGEVDSEVINAIFRAAHSIKGGSATFGLEDVASFTHVVETVLGRLRDQTMQPDQPTVDLLLASVDCLRDLLSIAKGGEPADETNVAEVQHALQSLLDTKAQETTGTTPQEVQQPKTAGWRIYFNPEPHLLRTGNDPLRILRELQTLGEYRTRAEFDELPPFEELDPESLYLSWEIELHGNIDRSDIEEAFAWVEDDCELTLTPLISTPTLQPVPNDSDSVSGELIVERRKGQERRKTDRRRSGATGDTSSIRVDIGKIDSVINLVGELVITQSMLSTLGSDFTMARLQQLHNGLAQLERNTRELQEQVMHMRMLPISFVFNRFPRMVHDLTAKLGKRVDFRMSGESTEVDKTLIEKLTDPLTHLVRNSLDHGIESPEERLGCGKTDMGQVSLNAYHKGGNIVIEVSDDGRGLDTDAILAKARKNDLIPEDLPLSEEQIYELIFLPGFSTADVVSDVSGRGVGMDVVRRNIQSLGGSIEVRSELNAGSCFTVRLPLTLAILDGQSVAVGEETYIVPLVSVVESIQVRPGMINYVAGGGETFRLREEYLPIVRLADVFGIHNATRELTQGLLMVVEGDGRRAGLFVDDLLGQQQVVIKSLEANYRKIEGVSGATVLGNGSVALILDVPGLIRLSSQIGVHREYA